jgi:hypothetical protein
MMAIGEGPELGDAFGRALSDMQAGRPGLIVVERDDGLIEADVGDYLSGWSDGDTWALHIECDRRVSRSAGTSSSQGSGVNRRVDHGHCSLADGGCIAVCRGTASPTVSARTAV